MLDSFLAGGRQCLQLDNIFSDWIMLNHSVLRGSVLGPWDRFLIYNDINVKYQENLKSFSLQMIYVFISKSEKLLN